MARTPLVELEPQRVCLIKPSALGDVIQALPVASALRQRWPYVHLSWVVNESFADLLADHPDIDEVIPFVRRGQWLRRLGSVVDVSQRLARGKFDLAIDLQGLLRSGAMCWRTGARRRVGFADAREGATFAYTDRIHVPWHIRLAVERNWQIAKALGCLGRPPQPRLGITAEHRDWAKRVVASLPRPLLIIHPGASWVTKRWPVASFALLAKRAQRVFQAGVLVIGGHQESRLCNNLVAGLDKNIATSIAGQATLRQLAAVLAEGDVYLSGDSGPMHLAAAVGTPVVAIYTCTSPARAAPYGPQHTCIATGVPCAASYRRTCSEMICMSDLTPEKVWPALSEKLIRATTSPRRAMPL